MTAYADTLVEITPQVLLKAYACGIFPMAESAEDNALYWIDPDRRGVLPFEDFHVPRRLWRVIRSQRFDIRIDTAFAATLDGCAEPAPGRRSTWINARIRNLYTELHKLGHCHSVECWREGRLVGGLYGVRLGGAFFGESMFSRETDASKVALAWLVGRLRVGGFSLLDTQFVTGHLQRFGAVELSREDYQKRLDAALAIQGDFFRMPSIVPPDALRQVLSQTS